MRKSHVLVGAIIVVVLAIRLFFALQTPYFSESEAYFTIRQAKAIQETGLPLFDDPLSYSGRSYPFTPAFHYLIATVGAVLPFKLVAKILPNVLASLLVIVVFLIAKRLTRNDASSLFAALIVGFIPIYMRETTNTLAVESLSIPLLFYLVFCFMHIKERRYMSHFLVTLVLASMTTPLTGLFLLALLVYLLFVRLENLGSDKQETELVIFGLFLFAWLQFLFYKNAFLMHGPLVIWQNIPHEILSRFFAEMNVVSAITNIGVIPLIYGVYAISQNMFKIKDRRIYLLISISLVTAALLWLRLISLEVGLEVLGVTMAILFSLFHKNASEYLKKTRIVNLTPLLAMTLLASLIVTAIMPAVLSTASSIDEAARRDDINALLWLKKRTDGGEVVLSSTKEGHLVSGVAERKNVMDTNYLLVRNIDDRYDDVRRMFTSPYETTALELLTEYDVRYILVSDRAKKEFGIDDVAYVSDERCFRKVYDNRRTIKIFEVRCRI